MDLFIYNLNIGKCFLKVTQNKDGKQQQINLNPDWNIYYK